MPAWTRKRKSITFGVAAAILVLGPSIVFGVLARPYKALAATYPAELRAARAEGVPMSMDDIDQQVSPAENAWTYYEQAGMAPPPANTRYAPSSGFVFFDLAAIRADYNDRKQSIALLAKGANLPKCITPKSEEHNFAVQFRLRGWVEALTDYAFCHASEKNWEEAGKDIRIAEGLTRHLNQMSYSSTDAETQLHESLSELLHSLSDPRPLLTAMGSWRSFDRRPFRDQLDDAIADSYAGLEKQAQAEKEASKKFSYPFVETPHPFYLPAGVALDAARAEALRRNRSLWQLRNSGVDDGQLLSAVKAYVASHPELCGYSWGGHDIVRLLQRVSMQPIFALHDHLLGETLRLIRVHPKGAPWPKKFHTDDSVVAAEQRKDQVQYIPRSNGFVLYSLGPNGKDNGGPGRKVDRGWIYEEPDLAPNSFQLRHLITYKPAPAGSSPAKTRPKPFHYK